VAAVGSQQPKRCIRVRLRVDGEVVHQPSCEVSHLTRAFRVEFADERVYLRKISDAESSKFGTFDVALQHVDR
jgi:hypothetical protein